MTAIWILLGIAVLLGGAIFAFVVYAIRHDDPARTPADTEIGRFGGRADAVPRVEAGGASPGDGPPATFVRTPRASTRPAGRDVEATR